jgi:hypothetical protein
MVYLDGVPAAAEDASAAVGDASAAVGDVSVSDDGVPAAADDAQATAAIPIDAGAFVDAEPSLGSGAPVDASAPVDAGAPVDGAELAGRPLIAGLGEWIPPPRGVVDEVGWVQALRGFARLMVWAIPAAAMCLALTGMWGWPTQVSEPSGTSPGTWLVVTMLGLLLGLVGVMALTALLTATPGRRWALVALLAVLPGTVLLAPVLGIIGVARPSVLRLASQMESGVAASLQGGFMDSVVSRWLGVGGLVLLAVGWFALGCAVLASGVLNRVDGFLLLVTVALAVLGAYLTSELLIVFASMVLLAAGLGLSWTASRLQVNEFGVLDVEY